MKFYSETDGYDRHALPQMQAWREGQTVTMVYNLSWHEAEGEDDRDRVEGETTSMQGTADYGAVVAALIRSRYTADQTEALMNNRQIALEPDSEITDAKREEYLSEYADYQQWRGEAKRLASLAMRQLEMQ